MKTCLAEEFGNHSDLFIDAGISCKGYEKVYLIPVVFSQIKTFFIKRKQISTRYGKALYERPPLKLILKIIFLWQIKTPFLIIKRLLSSEKLSPLKKIYGIYIEDQFISYCIRYANEGKNKKYVYRPNLFLFIKAYYSFSYSYFAAKQSLVLIEPIESEFFVTHEIYNYAAFVRTLSSSNINVTIPLKLPFSYTIPRKFNYGRNKFPPFLNSFYEKYKNEELLPEEIKIAENYIKKRLDPDSTELSYLNESPYSSKYSYPIDIIIKEYNKNKSNYFVLYLHAFTDDLHRYGFDDFETIWEWTLHTIKFVIKNTNKTIFVKIHPNQDIKSVHLVNRMDAKAVNELRKEFINFDRVFFLSNNFSNKDIICRDSSAIVITHHGNIVCEAAFYGIPCISSNMSPWNVLHNVRCWKSIEEYNGIISSIFNESLERKLDHENLYKAIINYYYDKDLNTFKPYYTYIIDFMYKKGSTIFDKPIGNYSRREIYEKLIFLYKNIQKNKNQVLYDQIVEKLQKIFNNSYYVQ